MVLTVEDLDAAVRTILAYMRGDLALVVMPGTGGEVRQTKAPIVTASGKWIVLEEQRGRHSPSGLARLQFIEPSPREISPLERPSVRPRQKGGPITLDLASARRRLKEEVVFHLLFPGKKSPTSD